MRKIVVIPTINFRAVLKKMNLKLVGKYISCKNQNLVVELMIIH